VQVLVTGGTVVSADGGHERSETEDGARHEGEVHFRLGPDVGLDEVDGRIEGVDGRVLVVEAERGENYDSDGARVNMRGNSR
jgi:hypothetical protein